jgi:cytoskeleton protein RodZ
VRGILPASVSEDKGCSIGLYLRENRESRGITLEDAARITRIGKSYLAALEDEKFDALPNPAYTKGFLRAYAAFLGLSGDKVIALYERDRHCADPGTSEPAEKADRGVSGPTSRVPLHRRWSASLFLLVLVLAAYYTVRDSDTDPGKNLSVLPTSSALVQLSRSSAVKLHEQAASSHEKTDNGPGPMKAEAPSFGIVLRLKADQDSSLNVTIDGLVSQQYDLKSGDLIEWKADKVITLDIGNAGGVEAEINGKPLKPLGEKGKSAHVVLKSDVASP